MNLADILDQHALTRPDHPAIQDGERIVSYAELKSKVVAAAANLNDAGIGFGDLVGVILNDSVEYIVVNYALAKLGAINIPINGRLPPSERERVVEGIGIKAVISNGKKTPLSMVPNLGVNQICRHTANALAQLPGSKSQLPFDENRTLMIVSSTGTTGSQKLIPMSHGQILSWNSAHQKYTGLMASDRYLSVVHFAFIAGSRRCIMMLHLGATVVINHATSVVNFFDQIAEKKINWTFLTPSHLKPLLARSPQATSPLYRPRQKFCRRNISTDNPRSGQSASSASVLNHIPKPIHSVRIEITFMTFGERCDIKAVISRGSHYLSTASR